MRLSFDGERLEHELRELAYLDLALVPGRLDRVLVLVTSFGQATTKRSIPPRATPSSIRISLGRLTPSLRGSLFQMRPPPAPQQK
jgi:hypothetical protein